MSNKKFKSIARVLRSKGKSSEEFENMINSLSIEELIGLKMEISSKVTGGKYFSFPLGITTYQYKQLLRKYKIREYFEKSD